MKTIAKACQAAAFAALIATPALAGGERTGTIDLDAAFGGSAPPLESLDLQAMENTRGRLALLAVPLSIAAVDLGLAALFWGVYVPHYTTAGACTTCSNMIQNH